MSENHEFTPTREPGAGIESTEIWDKIIEPKNNLLRLNIGEIIRYKDLLFLFVRRDFIAIYKQTILGPFWHIVQPIFTTLTFFIVFSRIANIPTDGIPPLLFYLSGVTVWMFFAKCLTSTSQTFITNTDIFSKVYFPRLIMPLSSMFSALISFGIQFALLAVVYFVYIFTGYEAHPNLWLLVLPAMVLIMAILGLGLGTLISSLTTKYRDLSFFVSFGVTLFMYVTPVIYPASSIAPQFRKILLLNPMAPVVEGFKYALFGAGNFSIKLLIYSAIASVLIFISGIILFNRVEKTFVDTV